jgi:hypothetical protein
MKIKCCICKKETETITLCNGKTYFPLTWHKLIHWDTKKEYFVCSQCMFGLEINELPLPSGLDDGFLEDL